MITLLLKIAITIGVALGLKEVSRRFGPRWGGLVLGFPTMTSLLTAFALQTSTSDSAVKSLEGSLTGVLAATGLAAAFAILLQRLRSVPLSLVLSMPIYGAVLYGVSLIGDGSFYLKSGLVAAGLFVLAELTGRCLSDRCTGANPTDTSRSELFFRVCGPVSMVLLSELLRLTAGAGAAGLVATFPTMLLVTVCLGCRSDDFAFAGRVIRGLPFANLSSLSFLTVLYFCLGFLPTLIAWPAAVISAAITLLLASVVSADVRAAIWTEEFSCETNLVEGVWLEVARSAEVSSVRRDYRRGLQSEETLAGGVYSMASFAAPGES